MGNLAGDRRRPCLWGLDDQDVISEPEYPLPKTEALEWSKRLGPPQSEIVERQDQRTDHQAAFDELESIHDTSPTERHP